MVATALDLSQIKTDALSSAATFRSLIELSSTDTPTFKGSTLTGGTVTASTPVLNATQTWNDAAVTFTGVKLDVTDTASAFYSLLVDLQVGGATKFSITKDGAVINTGSSPSLVFAGATRFQFNATNMFTVLNTGGMQWSSGGIGGPFDLKLFRDDAGVLAQRNNTNAQEFRLYNTYTHPGTSYERAFLKWDANVFKIGTEAAGTGTETNIQLEPKGKCYVRPSGAATNIDSDLLLVGKGTATARLYLQGGTLAPNKIFSTGIDNTAQTRQLDLCVSNIPVLSLKEDRSVFITTGSVTASTPALSLDQTWNNVATTFTGVKLDVTDTASASDSLLMDLQVGGTSKFSVNKDGRVNVAKINGSTSSAADPSTTEYPNDGDHGIHKNTTSGNVFLAYNDGGSSIVKVQLS